jgi:hypothetical protein
VRDAVLGSLTTAVVALSIAIVRTRERVVRLEEWIRLHELYDLHPGDAEAEPEEVGPTTTETGPGARSR